MQSRTRSHPAQEILADAEDIYDAAESQQAQTSKKKAGENACPTN
jgi:hypothetical protein